MIPKPLSGRFEATLDLGRGPLYHVYGAKEKKSGKEVCLRILNAPYSTEPEFLAKLEDVVTAASAVSHPNLERILEFVGGSHPAVVTEFSHGTSLLERLKKLGSVSVPVAVQTAIGVCEASAALHLGGFAHGEIGSQNVVIGPEGDLKLQMYSTWQSYASSASAGAAMLPQMAPYLAPEIGKGGFPSPASDVYAIGVLLYEMLSGRYPFHGDSPVAIALKHATDPAPNVRMMNPSVPLVLAEIVKKAMAKEPEERYRDANDLRVDLKLLQDALRFGRTLSWPLRESSKPSTPQPVAPKMSAIKTSKKASDYDEDEESADVPTWVKVLIAFFAGLLTLFVLAWVVFNMNKPRTVEIPDLKRLTVAEAISRLDGLGLKLRIGRRQTSDQIGKDQVIDVNPKPGEFAYEGSTVSVTVSAGTKFVEVPDVKGLTLDQATSMLASVDLAPEDETETVADANVKEGLVAGQEPDVGNKVGRNSKIRLKLSGGKDYNKKEDKTAKLKYQWTLKITLSDLQTRIRMKVTITDAKGTRTIHEQEHDPEEYVELIAEGYGDKATFKIYYDDELVSEVEKTAEDPDAELIE